MGKMEKLELLRVLLSSMIKYNGSSYYHNFIKSREEVDMIEKEFGVESKKRRDHNDDIYYVIDIHEKEYKTYCVSLFHKFGE